MKTKVRIEQQDKMAVQSVSLFFSLSVLTAKSCIYFYMLLMTWSSCYTSVTGQYQVIGSSQDILVKEGDDVILPCLIKPPFNMETKTVEWSRPDLKPKLINLLKDGHFTHDIELNPLYTDRTSLFHDPLRNGNMSLKLSRVKLSDEGKYRCFAPHVYSSTLIQLLVGSGSQPVISSNGPTDGGVSLSCDSGCWYPQPEMSWLDGDGNNITAGPSVTDTPSQHCYDVQRNVTVRTAGLVTCRVHLPRFNHTVETQHYISEDVIHTERGSTGGWIAGIVILIIIILVAAVGYIYWQKHQTVLLEAHPQTPQYEQEEDEEMKALMDLSNQPLTSSDLITNDEDIRIVMVGKTGSGKSSSGNTILGYEAFISTFSPYSVTSTCSKASGAVAGRKVSVINTPGLFNTTFTMKQTLEEVYKCITCAAPGPHVFLAVIRLETFREEERNVGAKIQKAFGQSSNAFFLLQKAFGQSSDKYTMILFTHGDGLKGSFEDIVNDSPELQELISKYRGFYHVFNNESKDPSSQVSELMVKINRMVQQNGGSHYTNEMFQEEARRQVSQFVDQHRRELIQRVTRVDHILDLLLEKGVISSEGYSVVRSKANLQDKMKELYRLLQTTRAKEVFYKGLEEHEKSLLADLKSRGEDPNLALEFNAGSPLLPQPTSPDLERGPSAL